MKDKDVCRKHPNTGQPTEEQQQAYQTEQQLLRAQGAVFWEELRSKLPERLTQFNISLGGIVVLRLIEVSPNELKLENKKSHVMTATLRFEPAQSTIYVHALNTSHEFHFKLFAGQSALYSRELGQKTPVDLIKYVLEGLANSIR
ncbi:MAG TPA: hypothetical protein VK525_10995 [Candidatus Saccharimonadales bacterium]|jgi:hypothetical protein|nr:hypothetical protein [Candidatus Saccharimonadales bacterium]